MHSTFREELLPSLGSTAPPNQDIWELITLNTREHQTASQRVCTECTGKDGTGRQITSMRGNGQKQVLGHVRGIYKLGGGEELGWS